MKYVNLPKKLEHYADTASDLVFWNIQEKGYYIEYQTAMVIKTICIALIPYMKKYGIGSVPFFQSLENYDEECMDNVWNNLELMSYTLLHKLTTFDWEIELEELFYDYGRGEVHSLMDYTNTPLKNFSICITGMIECIHTTNSGFYNIPVTIFSNKRLGKFFDYANKNPVNKDLLKEITSMVSKIEGFYRTNTCIESTLVNGVYKILYIFHDFEHDETRDMHNLSFLMPFYAYNLKCILDEAYELYPIE